MRDATITMPDGSRPYNFYREKNVLPEILTKVFDENGDFRSQFAWQELYGLQPEHLLEEILNKLEPLYILQQIQLDQVFVTGFNDHGPLHIRRVAERTFEFLKLAAVPTHLLKLGILAACTHDLGNMIVRKGHQLYSWALLAEIIEDFGHISDSDKHILELTIVAHDEGSLHEMVSEDIPMIAWALILADKTDVSYQRVTKFSDQKAAVNDPHIVVNFMVDESCVSIFLGKNLVEWRLAFNPRANAVKDGFRELLKNDERKWVPDLWQDLYRDEQIEYVFVFFAKIITLYIDRLEMAVLASMVLYGDAEEFVFCVEDQERNIKISRTFLRHNYEEQLARLRNNLEKGKD